MKKPIAAWSSDTHLTPYTWAKHPTLRTDAFVSFAQIIQFCNAEGLPLFLAGDVFNERRPDSLTVEFARRQMVGMIQYGYEVFFVEGQHDMAAPPWLEVCGAKHLDKKSVRVGQLDIYGLNFTNRTDLAEELKKIPRNTDVLMAHQVWEEFMGRIRVVEGSLKDVPTVGAIVTGDYHRHDQFDVVSNVDGRKVNIVSPGSTHMRTIDEDPRKFFYVMYDDLSFESKPLVTRRCLVSRVANDEQFEASVAAIQIELSRNPDLPESIRKPIWAVYFRDDIPDVHRRLEAWNAKELVHLFEFPIRPKKEEKTEDISDSEMLGGLRSALLKEYDTDSLIGKTALRMLDSPNPKQELDQIVKEVEEHQAQWSVFG